MAGLMCQGRIFFGSSWHNFLPMLTQLRTGYYSSKYLDPVLDKEELQKLEETDPRLYRSFKAAKTEQRTSLSYHSDIEKFINLMMYEGKKDAARREVYKSFEQIKRIQIEKHHKAETEEAKMGIELNPQKIFLDAVNNCKPLLRLTRVSRAGSYYEVPIYCKPDYQKFKAMRFLISSCQEKGNRERFYDKLAKELIAASNNEGSSVRKKIELFKRCEANKAYVTYKWL